MFSGRKVQIKNGPKQNILNFNYIEMYVNKLEYSQ